LTGQCEAETARLRDLIRVACIDGTIDKWGQEFQEARGRLVVFEQRREMLSAEALDVQGKLEREGQAHIDKVRLEVQREVSALASDLRAAKVERDRVRGYQDDSSAWIRMLAWAQTLPRWKERRRLIRRVKELEGGLADRRRHGEKRIKQAKADALRRLKESEADYARRVGAQSQRIGETADEIALRVLKVEAGELIPTEVRMGAGEVQRLKGEVTELRHQLNPLRAREKDALASVEVADKKVIAAEERYRESWAWRYWLTGDRSEPAWSPV
jgi:hypothetical protein